MSQGKGRDGRMAMIAVLAVAILAISLRVLMSMETSLEEGRAVSYTHLTLPTILLV